MSEKKLQQIYKIGSFTLISIQDLSQPRIEDTFEYNVYAAMLVKTLCISCTYNGMINVQC